MEIKACKCGGMNEECIYCGGSGDVQEKKIEVIKLFVDKNTLKKETIELDIYLHKGQDKLYDFKFNPVKKRPKKGNKNKNVSVSPKDITENPFINIGPLNPNRIKNNHTPFNQKSTKRKEKLDKKQKIKEFENIQNSRKIKNPEFFIFWIHQMNRTIDNEEYNDCMEIYESVSSELREKFKKYLIKKFSYDQLSILPLFKDVYETIEK